MEAGKAKAILEVPIAVQIVAYTMLLLGLWAAVGMLVRLGHRQIYFDFTFLGIFIGFGLLGLRNGWRIGALVFITIVWIATIVISCLLLSRGGPIPYELMGNHQGYIPWWTLWVTAAGSLALFSWFTWVLARPSTAQLFHASKEASDWQYRKPGWAIFWIAILIIGSLGQSLALCQMAKNPIYQPPPAWHCSHQSLEGERQHRTRKGWDKTIDWQTTKYANKKSDYSHHIEITAIARKDNKELARFVCEYEADWHSFHPLSFHLTDSSLQVDPDYTIRSTVSVNSSDVGMELSLVSTQHDHSFNTISLIDEGDDHNSGGYLWETYRYCPSLKFTITYVSRWGEKERYAQYVAAKGIVQLPAPAGMFPGTTQPIDWTLYVRRLDHPDWIEEYHILAGEYETQSEKERRKKEQEELYNEDGDYLGP